jgi:hypothetical protein
MELHFKDGIVGFYLTTKEKNSEASDQYDLGLVEFSNNEKGEIFHFAFTFYQESLSQPENIDIELNNSPDYKKIAGTYTVPELNINNRPFIDVLNAVKNYYKAV